MNMSEIKNMGAQRNDDVKNSNDLFSCLCDNVEAAIITSNESLQQMYLFHDKLGEKNFPISIIKKLTAISSTLQKNMSHLLNGVERLIEKTRMYAQPFEKQCDVLKELRDQNGSKQRKLDIAVKKLEIMSGRNQQLEKQRIVGKWERLFLKSANLLDGNLGWRHTVKEYKRKTKRNESVAFLFQGLDSEESSRVENIAVEDTSNDVPLQDENDFHLSSNDEIDSQYDRFSTATSREEELMFESHLGESSIFDWVSKNSTEVRKSCDIDELSLQSFQISKSRLSNDTFCNPEQNAQLPVNSTLIQPENPELVNIAPTNPAFMHSIVETPKMVDAYTSTTQFDNFFQVRIINPTWVNNKTLFCIITFGSQVKKGYCQVINPYDLDTSLENSEVKKRHGIVDGFCFNLENSSDDILKSEGLKNISIRIALHEDRSAGMLAFSSINTNDICIYMEHEIQEGNKTNYFHNLELHFPSKNNVKDDSNHLSIICSVYQEAKQCVRERSTSTMTYDDLVRLILQDDINSRRERCKSACMETEEKPIYTEECFNAVNNELIAFKEGCENSIECKIRVDASTSPLFTYTSGIEDQYDDGVQYYPRHSSCPGRHVTFDNENIYSSNKAIKRELTIPKMSTKSKRICEKLPEDFFTRLRIFHEERGKKHEDLKKEIREKNHEEMCKRLEAEKKLCLPDGSSTLPHNCLPAVFMPIKNNLVYKVKARSYFHPSNQAISFAQSGSILQLPNVQSIMSNRNLLGLRLEAAETGK